MMNSDKQRLDMGDADDIQLVYKMPSNRLLVVVCVILLLCCVGLLVALVIVAVYSARGSAEVCNSRHCLITAGQLMEIADPSVDPCENFADFACGGFFNTTVIPEDRNYYATYHQLDDNLEVILRELVKKKISNTDIAAERKVKDLYTSCKDLDTIERIGAKPLTNLLHEFGGWPVLGNKYGGRWNETDYDLAVSMGRLTGEFFIDGVVSSWVGIDDKNSTRHVLKIDQPTLGMSRNYYLDNDYADYKKAYLDYIVAVATLLGADKETAISDMKNVLEFETKLANMSVPDEERRDSEANYNPTTIGDLQESLPLINWAKFFDVLMPSEAKPLPNTERVINQSPTYFANAVRVFVEETPARVVANYLAWKLALMYVSKLSKAFRDARQDYLKVIEGIETVPARWRQCVLDVNYNLEFATGRMYVTDNFPRDSKVNVEKMIANLKTAFKDMLELNDWMDEETKVVAREKCDAIRVHVGYPDWIMDDDAINDFYSKLDILPGQFFENNLNLARWSVNRAFTRLRKPVDSDEWITGPAVVNAFYSASHNRIVFPAGILQHPFYDEKSPGSLNYGGIGAVIGHELTHGFDDSGRQYDKDGNLRQWWSDKSIEHFKVGAQCIVDQYSSYVAPENNKKLNGILTQGENIADNGGLKEAFKAYLANEYSNINLPGFSSYTSEQLFFLGYAQTWCGLYRPEAIDRAITSGSHSPDRFRIIGPLQNSIDFAKAFNCPVGSYMNPPSDKKCGIW